MDKNPTMTPRKRKFYEAHENDTDAELLREILYKQEVQLDIQERTRRNTVFIIWWVIGIPVFLTLLIAAMQ